MLIEIPHAKIDKGIVSDEMSVRYSPIRASGSGNVAGDREHFTQVPRNPATDVVLDEAGIALMQDVLKHPDSGVRERYARLGLAVSTGHRLKSRLVRDAWLEPAVVPVGRTRKVLLHITPMVRRRLGLSSDYQPSSQLPLLHRYWKQYYADMLRHQGFAVEVESVRNSGGRSDIVGLKHGKSIGVEIETGRSDVCENVRRDLLAGTCSRMRHRNIQGRRQRH